MIENDKTAIFSALTALDSSVYTAGTVTPVPNASQLNISLVYTKGDETSVQVKCEFSPDGTNWYQQTSEEISGGVASAYLQTHSYAATGNYMISTPASTYKFRISVKCTGGTPTGTLAASLQRGNA